MELTNATPLAAGYTLGMQKDGRELLVVAAKATFSLPHGEGTPVLSDAQVPLTHTDVFTGEPGRSALLYEIDFAPRKLRCDVLLNGSAHAPGGRPAARVPVSLRVGSVQKAFSVVGDRVWERSLLGLSASSPARFTQLGISYDRAFGGVERTPQDPPREHWYPDNHAGVSAHKYLARRHIAGEPLPNTEANDDPVVTPYGKYAPMAFGPIGRAWRARARWAGTYDKQWVDEVMPFLPADFDERYYQSAPEDQQLDHPSGGELVELRNLTRTGLARFPLPSLQLRMTFALRTARPVELKPVLDTIVLEPDQERMLLVWRASLPLRRNVFDVRQVTLQQRS